MAFKKGFVYPSVGLCMKPVVQALLLQVTIFISRTIVSGFLRWIRGHTPLDYFCEHWNSNNQSLFLFGKFLRQKLWNNVYSSETRSRKETYI